MQASDDLYLLIKSLTKAEKRHFKLQTSLQKGEKDYQILFEAIDSLPDSSQGNGEQNSQYDESLLKKKIEGKINTSQLHVAKNYLYGLILKSLRTLNEKQDTNSQLSTQIADARLLEQRGMYEQTVKKLTLAKSLALKFEKYIALIEILQLEISLCTKRQALEVESELERLNFSLLKYNELLHIEIQFNFLKNSITALYRKSVRVRGEDARQKIEQLKRSPLLKADEAALSFLSKVSYHYCKAVLSLMEGDVSEAVGHYQDMYHVWVGYPHFKEEYPAAYIIYTSNYLIGCHMVRNYSLFPDLLAELKKVPTKTFDEEAEAFQNIMFLEQLYFMNCRIFVKNGNFMQECKQLAEKIESGLIKYSSRIVKSRCMTFYHNTAIMFFALGDFDATQYWLSKILQTMKTDQRKDIQIVAKLLQLIIFLEQGLYLYIDNAFKSFEYHLKKEDKLHDFEGRVTFHLKQVASMKHDRKKIFQAFSDALKQFESQKLPGHEEISIWVESKVKNLTFLEVLRQRARIAQT